MLRFLSARSRRLKRAKTYVHLRTSPFAFALWWLGLLVLHGANLAYYVGVARIYVSFEKTYLNFQLTVYGIGVPSADHGRISKIHAFIAALHAFFIVLMIVSSLHARKLVFSPDMRPVYRWIARTPYLGKLLSRVFGTETRKSQHDVNPKGPSSTSRRVSSTGFSHRLSETRRLSSVVFARDGLLGVDSVYFDHVVLVRELIETGLQSIQLYRMTLVLPRLWLIRFYLALLVANCWAVPFLHRYYRDRETTRRMLCLLCDAVLDMMSSIGVSIVIFATYAPQYVDPHGFGFSFITWFDDEWISNMQQEFQIMVVASWGDMASRLVFAFGLMQCMDAIKDMLTPPAALTLASPPKFHSPTPHFASTLSPSLVVPSVIVSQTDDVMPCHSTEDVMTKEEQQQPTECAAVSERFPNTTIIREAAKQDEHAHESASVSGTSAVPAQHEKRSFVSRVVTFVVHVMGPGLFVTWGFLMLVVHIYAESRHSKTDCSLILKPWFSTKPGCSLVEIDCAALQSNGRDDAMDAAWDSFDPNRAARVVIRHCPELQVSPKITKFHTMSGFKIYNSTVLLWDERAALTESNHANMRSVILLRTTLPNGELPVALLSPTFPKGLTNFYAATTNLQSLPTNLDTIWPHNMQLMLESSLFTEIPDVVIRLEPNSLSMAGTPISVIKAELIESSNLMVLQIGLTRVQELPPTVKRIHPSFTVLFAQYTNISVFPAWLNGYANFMTHFPSRLFNAYDSPYCRELNEIIAGNRTAFSLAATVPGSLLMDVSTPEKLAFVQHAIDCTDTGPLFYYPLPLEDMKHGLRA